MKWLIKSKDPIYAMAYNRQVARQKMLANSSVLNEHIIKIIAYKDIRKQTIPYWISELANFLCLANSVKCKSKLKPKDYYDTIFAEFGDALADAKYNLFEYIMNNLKKPKESQYPDFEVTEDLVKALFAAYKKIIDVCLPIFMSQQEPTASEWITILKPVFTS